MYWVWRESLLGVRRICGRTRGKYFCLVVKLQAQRRPDSEQIEPAGAKPLRRNSVSVEQIQEESSNTGVNTLLTKGVVSAELCQGFWHKVSQVWHFSRKSFQKCCIFWVVSIMTGGVIILCNDRFKKIRICWNFYFKFYWYETNTLSFNFIFKN